MIIDKLINLGLKSTLKEAAEKAPAKLPAEQLPTYLRGQGVTEDEMKFSGVKFPAEGVIEKNTLLDLVDNRTDDFSVVTREDGKQIRYGDNDVLDVSQSETKYKDVNLPARREDLRANYREDIYTFNNAGPHDPIVAQHWPDVGGYVAHARRQDMEVDGQRTRVVLEIQSDTANNLQRGRVSRVLTQNQASDATVNNIVVNGDKNALAKFLGFADDWEVVPQEKRATEEAFNKLVDGYYAHGPAYAQHQLRKYNVGVEQPWTKSFRRRVLEAQVAKATADGLTRIAVPLEGSGLASLGRGGNQKMYETAVRSELQRIAKKQGWNYKEVQETIAKGHFDDAARREYNKQFGKVWRESQLYENLNDLSTYSQIDPYVTENMFDEVVDVLEEFNRITKTNLGPDTMDDKVSTAISHLMSKFNRQTRNRAVNNVDREQAAIVFNYFDSLVDEMAKPKDVVYGVIDTGGKAPAQGFSLYSTPAAGAFAAYTALQAGVSEERVRAQMEESGETPEEIELALKNVKLIEQARAQGVSDEAIKKHLDRTEVVVAGQETKNPIKPGSTDKSYWNPKEFGDKGPKDPRLPTQQEQNAKAGANLAAKQKREAANWGRQMLMQKDISMQDLLASLRSVYPTDAALHTSILSIGGSEEATQVAEEIAKNADTHIVAELKRRGIDAHYDAEVGGYVDAEGRMLDGNWWEQFKRDMGTSKEAISFSLAGSMVGMRAGASKGPWAAGVGAFLGGMAGGAAGSGLDYVRDATRIGAELQGSVAARKMLNEAEWAIVGDAAGAAILKLGSASVSGAKRFIDLIRARDLKGAGQALRQHMHLTEEETQEIVRDASRIINITGASQQQRDLVLPVLTQPGGETIVEAAVKNKPSVGSAIVKDVNTRAKELLTKTAALKDNDAAQVILGDLKNYQYDVKMQYSDVKARASMSTKNGMYAFNIENLAVQPLLRDIAKTVHDPMLQEKLVNKLRHIDALGSSRSFADLLELRKVVHSLTYSKAVINSGKAKELDSAIQAIDKEIRRGAQVAVDNPTQWLKDWDAANKSYSEMKRLENNVLFKTLMRPGMDPAKIAKNLYAYSTSTDSTFVDVLNKLPKQSRVAVEAEVFDIIANKYTEGVEGGFRATHFPALAKELRQIPFTSPEARKLQHAVLRMAEVFKNDVRLGYTSGVIQTPQFQSYLTADPVMRAKFALASGVFSKVKEIVPGEMQRNLALVNTVIDVLEEPLNQKALDTLVKEASGKVDLSAQLRDLAAAAAREAAGKADKEAGRVVVYGDGKLVSLKPQPGQAKGKPIPLHRIASLEDARLLARAEGVNPADVKAVDKLLRDHGYVAVQQGNEKLRRID